VFGHRNRFQDNDRNEMIDEMPKKKKKNSQKDVKKVITTQPNPHVKKAISLNLLLSSSSIFDACNIILAGLCIVTSNTCLLLFDPDDNDDVASLNVVGLFGVRGPPTMNDGRDEGDKGDGSVCCDCACVGDFDPDAAAAADVEDDGIRNTVVFARESEFKLPTTDFRKLENALALTVPELVTAGEGGGGGGGDDGFLIVGSGVGSTIIDEPFSFFPKNDNPVLRLTGLLPGSVAPRCLFFATGGGGGDGDGEGDSDSDESESDTDTVSVVSSFAWTGSGSGPGSETGTGLGSGTSSKSSSSTTASFPVSTSGGGAKLSARSLSSFPPSSPSTSTGLSMMTDMPEKSKSTKWSLRDNLGGPSLAALAIVGLIWVSSKEDGGVSMDDSKAEESDSAREGKVGDDFERVWR
jgi:hypothetical protein